MKKHFSRLLPVACLAALSLHSTAIAQPADHLVFQGSGAGKDKHIVLLAGDEEYRSEEALPMLGQMLSKHHGFKCTVLFSMNDKGEVDPKNQKSLSNPAALDSADLIVMSLRFRNWNDAAMEKFEKAIQRGTPIIALRTSTHAFKFPKNSKWFKYSFNASKETGWHKGFGRHVLGETWVNHHGQHKKEGCRSVVEDANKNHPILNGVGTIFAESDVYGTNPPSDVTILQRGQVTKTLDPKSEPVAKKNNPMQPLTWIREYKNASGKTNKIFTTTMGAASDLDDANLRRLVANACFWALNLEVPKSAKVDVPASYKPTFYGFNTFKKGTKPADHIPTDAAPQPAGAEGAAVKPATAPTALSIKKNGRIAIIGAGLASRMMKYGHFETELQLRYPEHKLTIRNIADEGNTPAFRPHPGRPQQLAFPGAEKHFENYASGKSGPWTSGAKGHFETPDQWLTRLAPDTIIAFFGFNSAMRGKGEVDRYKKELAAFIDHTLKQKYNGEHAPQLAVVSPTAIQDLSATHHTPDGKKQNELLSIYTLASQEVCAAKGVLFIDAFSPSKAAFDATKQALTVDGALLTSDGYQWLAGRLADDLYGKATTNNTHRELVHAAVMEKNFVWHNLFKIPNGVHVYGRRYKPFGPQNYPDELKKLAEMTEIRDHAIWRALEGKKSDLKIADAKTHKLPPVPTNYKPSKKNGETRYLSGTDTLKHLAVPEGYKIELFADEKMFPELANPVQMSFDNKGRLWVGCMPSYPHWRPGDPKPADKLIIFEDTNNDGKADKRTIFADDLHLVIGFELAKEGVYVSQADSVILLTDTNGDDKYDTKEYLISGFDDHDTHHAISAFCADPSGAIYMGEGVFLHSNVESVYGTHRGTNGGHFRYNPKRRHLERTAQLRIPNPWGTAFDKWGQNFFLHTSGTSLNWMAPGTVKPRYGQGMQASKNLVTSNQVRPTSGLEFVSSRHFPDDVQGDILLGNAIGFLGIKQHKVEEDGTGYKLSYRQDLLKSSEGNFRPVDLEFAPDGSLYVIDWSNVLIGHMQHNARDPHRDHVHGRIYRITYPSRPLVKPSKVAGASISELLENLKVYEDRTRYRTRRELRGRDTAEVLGSIKKWIGGLDKNDPNYEHYLLEALWVTWGHDKIDQGLLNQLLTSEDHRVRSAATRAVRYNTHQLANHTELLKKSAADSHGRVRMEAMTAASWLPKNKGLAILDIAEKTGVDAWTKNTVQFARAVLTNSSEPEPEPKINVPPHLKGSDALAYKKGYEIYHRDAHCATCHQANGLGLPAGGFPPLAETKWVNEDIDRLIKITLKGIKGPITVKGKQFNGAMTPFGGLLNDKEVAEVLTYVKNSFGNKSGVVNAARVKKVRADSEKMPPMPDAADLLKQHPHK
ncbi:MAG: PVC-type heme-binding CxxCH protein [Akkermansiaceae bacterium]